MLLQFESLVRVINRTKLVFLEKVLQLVSENKLKYHELNPEMAERFAQRALADPDFLAAARRGEVDKLSESIEAKKSSKIKLNSFGHKGASGNTYSITGKNSMESFDIQAGVTYLNNSERAALEVFVGNDGLLYKADGVLLDTEAMATHFSGQGRAIYVMDDKGRIFINNQKLGSFHHSSFLAGKDVAAAGEIVFSKGKLKYLNAKSGHYRPQPWESVTGQIKTELETRGAQLIEVKIEGGF